MQSDITALATDDPAWFAFAQRHPDATVFHHPAWTRTVTDAYGYGSRVLATTDASGHIVAGLPGAGVRDGAAGAELVAFPFTDVCPPLAADEDALTRLGAALEGWRQSARCRRLEVR